MDNVLFKVENAVGYIVLNRPDKANAMVLELKEELLAILRSFRQDKSVRAVVVTGNGKNFCSGGDLSTMGEKQTAVEGRERMKLAGDWLKELVALEKPTIAAVSGSAAGGGLSLALACDQIICTETAKFNCSFIKVGLVADMATLYFLPRRIGIGQAKRLAYTGTIINGVDAQKIGLADMAVPEDQFDLTVKEYAEKLAQGPTYTLGMTKTLLNQSFENNFQTFLDLETSLQAVAFQTEDHRGAVKGFFAKNKYNFIGE